MLLFGNAAEGRAFSFLEKREAEKQATRSRLDKYPRMPVFTAGAAQPGVRVVFGDGFLGWRVFIECAA